MSRYDKNYRPYHDYYGGATGLTGMEDARRNPGSNRDNPFSQGFGKGIGSTIQSIFGAPGRMIDGYIDGYFQKRSMEAQASYNKELMDYQDDLNKAAVDRQNAYNSPSAVSARARAAGVAPSALLGGSAGSPGISSLQSASSGANVSPGSAPSKSLFDLLTRTQIRNIEANTNAANAEAADKDASADLKKQSLADVQWYNANIRDLDQKLKNAGVDKAEAEAAIAQAEEAYQKWMLNPDDPANSQAAAKLFAAIDNLKALTGEANASAELKKEQKDTEETKQSVNKATVSKIKDEQTLLQKQADFYAESTEKAKTEGKLISAQTTEAQIRQGKLFAEIVNLGKQYELTEQQIAAIKNNVALSWAKFGVNTAISISQEARAWVNPFKKGAKHLDDRSPEDWSSDTGYNPFDY